MSPRIKFDITTDSQVEVVSMLRRLAKRVAEWAPVHMDPSDKLHIEYDLDLEQMDLVVGEEIGP